MEEVIKIWEHKQEHIVLIDIIQNFIDSTQDYTFSIPHFKVCYIEKYNEMGSDRITAYGITYEFEFFWRTFINCF